MYSMARVEGLAECAGKYLEKLHEENQPLDCFEAAYELISPQFKAYVIQQGNDLAPQIFAGSGITQTSKAAEFNHAQKRWFLSYVERMALNSVAFMAVYQGIGDMWEAFKEERCAVEKRAAA